MKPWPQKHREGHKGHKHFLVSPAAFYLFCDFCVLLRVISVKSNVPQCETYRPDPSEDGAAKSL
jgi:hypothetical protein